MLYTGQMQYQDFFTDLGSGATPIMGVVAADFSNWLAGQTEFVQQFIRSQGFLPKKHAIVVPKTTGAPDFVLWCFEPLEDFWQIAHLAVSLPAGQYALSEALLQSNARPRLDQLCLAWALAQYEFNRYKTKATPKPARQLVWPQAVNQADVLHCLDAAYMVRDLVNTPAEDLSPAMFVQHASKALHDLPVTTQVFEGEELKEMFPMVYAVGRAAHSTPRVMHVRWGNPSHPKLALVGKGVCYDTGGLSLKSSANMFPMKKDMGGAAHALALAKLIMLHNLPLHIDLVLPLAENNIGSYSYRPSDVLTARNGTTVEITNTDAEGRLLLADALSFAQEQQPDLLIDFATLTGAGRVALGPDVPGFFANKSKFISEIMTISEKENDLSWPLPLVAQYRHYLDSHVADISNANTKHAYGGAITAALFLQHFVDEGMPWVHFDLMSANMHSLPGRPEGGDMQGLRAMLVWLKSHFELG